MMPSKQDCFYVLEMLGASLIDYSYTHPWAEELILEMDSPPSWLCDLATKKYRNDQIKAVREFVYSEPFESVPSSGNEKFAIACLWLRFERRELSWATFLRMAGDILDSVNSDWDCETPYYYLSVFEDAYFTASAEERTRQDYLNNHDLKPWIEEARARLEPFLALRRDKKRMEGNS